MSTRTIVQRAAASVAGVALIAGLGLGSPFASAAPTSSISADNVAVGEIITFSGTECVSSDGKPTVVKVAGSIPGASEDEIGFLTVNQDGSWTATTAALAKEGKYSFYSECQTYLGEKIFAYETQYAQAVIPSVVPDQVVISKEFSVSATGFLPGETVVFERKMADGTYKELARGIADANGKVTMTVPPQESDIVIRFRGLDSGRIADGQIGYPKEDGTGTTVAKKGAGSMPRQATGL